MALLPSLILILGALAIALFRGRRSRSISSTTAGIAVAATVALSQQLPSALILTLWRPAELFGPGFVFSIDGGTWPFLLLGSVVVLAEMLLDGRSTVRLIYAGIGLAAIAAGNLLTIAMLWTLMVVLESGLRWMASKESLWKPGTQFAAITAVLAAANNGQSAAILLMLAAAIRSIGGSDSRFPFTLAVLAPLGAFAAVGRNPTQVPWLAAGVLLFALAHTLFLGARLPSLAVALIGAGLLASADVQGIALAAGAAALVAIAGMHHVGWSRFAWGAVAVLPFALTTEPGLLILGVLVTAALAAIARIQPPNSKISSLAPIEIGSIALMLAAAALALVSSGWSPGLWGAIAAGAGLLAGYGISLTSPWLSNLRFPRVEGIPDYGVRATSYLAALVRTTADVLEGESAVLWILLVLLITVIGLQAVAV